MTNYKALMAVVSNTYHKDSVSNCVELKWILSVYFSSENHMYVLLSCTHNYTYMYDIESKAYTTGHVSLCFLTVTYFGNQ